MKGINLSYAQRNCSYSPQGKLLRQSVYVGVANDDKVTRFPPKTANQVKLLPQVISMISSSYKDQSR